MAHVLEIPDDRYHVLSSLAAERHQTPEEVLSALVDEEWQRACAKYDAAFGNDPEWVEGAREAMAAAGQATIYQSEEEFFAALDAVPSADDDSDADL
jgi:hypothetical protein